MLTRNERTLFVSQETTLIAFVIFYNTEMSKSVPDENFTTPIQNTNMSVLKKRQFFRRNKSNFR